MTAQEILSNIRMLAQSQGFYGRLLEAVTEENPELLDYLAEQEFEDVVDMILFLES